MFVAPIHSRFARAYGPLILALALSACGNEEEQADETSAAETEMATTSVEAVTLQTSRYREVIELVGTTEPIRSANLSSELGGRLVTLDLEEGERVEQGAQVLRVDDSTIRARSGSIEAQLEQVRTDQARTRALIERGLGTQAALEQLNTQEVILLESLNELSVTRRQTRSRAPIAGEVTETFAEVGEVIAPGSPVARIVDVSTIIVKVGLPEREIAHVSEGMRVQLTLEATGQVLEGELTRIGVEANTRNRTFPLEITVNNEEREVRAGMRVRAEIERRTIADALMIPRDAVLQGLEGEEVFLAVNGEAQRRSVEIGQGTGRLVLASSGLAEGETLIVRGQHGLFDGEALNVIDMGACCSDELPTETRENAEQSAL